MPSPNRAYRCQIMIDAPPVASYFLAENHDAYLTLRIGLVYRLTRTDGISVMVSRTISELRCSMRCV